MYLDRRARAARRSRQTAGKLAVEQKFWHIVACTTPYHIMSYHVI
jgi:hypothetical protein